jgi:predicted glycosyltransferase involved in capsule biosynthesis
MKLGIVVPLRLNSEREQSFEYVHNWLKTKFVDVPIYLSDSNGEQFNVSEARNRGCLRAINDGVDILMVIDADTVVLDIVKLSKAFELATFGVASMTKGYVKLDEQETEEMLAGGEMKNKNFKDKVMQNTSGGLWVLPVTVFQQINGWDERFIGWGYEDNALLMAYKKIYGEKIRRIKTTVLSFYHHTRDFTIDSYLKNQEKYNHYKAVSSKEEMLKMVGGNMTHLDKK